MPKGAEGPTVLLLFDQSGVLQAASITGELPEGTSSAAIPRISEAALAVSRGDSSERNIIDLVGRDSELAAWLSDQMQLAHNRDGHFVQSSHPFETGTVRLRLNAVRNNGSLWGFALHVWEETESSSEGESVVTRQQWHDIKNQLGGIKLYATFLKRKLPDGEDKDTVQKILNGIDGLIEDLSSIRRGGVR